MSHMPASPAVIPPGSITDIVNVGDYSAAGDGATDDTAVIQAALNAAVSGTIVYVPTGTYLVSTLNIPTSGVVLAGAGRGSVLKQKAGSNTSLLTHTAGIVDVSIRDLTIDGNNANQTAAPSRGANGILILDAQRVTISNVYVHSTYTNGIRIQKATSVIVNGCLVKNAGKPGVSASGIDVNANSLGEDSTDVSIVNNDVDTITGTGNGIFAGSYPGTTNCRRVLIASNRVRSAADEGIEVLRVRDFAISDNVITASAAIGVYCRESSHGSIAGNSILGGMVGISLDTQLTTSVSDVSVTGNSIADAIDDSVNGAGILLTTGPGYTVTGCTVASNRIVDCKRNGIHLVGTGIAKTAVVGNTVSGCDGSGIAISGTAGSFTVSANVCYNNGQNAALTNSSGVYVFDTLGGVAAGNYCFDDQGSPTQKYGVYITGTSGKWTVIGNRTSGNTVSDMTVNASGGNIRRVANSDASNTDVGTLYSLILDQYMQAKGTPSVDNDAISIGFTAPAGIIAAKNTSGAPAANLLFKTTDGSNVVSTVLTLSFDKTATFESSVGLGGSSGPRLYSGSGTPEGAVTAVVGSLYLRTNGGATTTLYIKESGAGNTGWVAK